MARVLVVGAGVIGLSCAVRLLERGHEVAVVARDLPLETTSAVAAALWYPYLAHPPERVAAWARTTYDVLTGLADDPRTGSTSSAARSPGWRSPGCPTAPRSSSTHPASAPGCSPPTPPSCRSEAR